MNYTAPVTPLFPVLPQTDAQAEPPRPESSGGVLDALLQSPKFLELLSPEHGGNVIELVRAEEEFDIDIDIDMTVEEPSQLGQEVDRALACR